MGLVTYTAKWLICGVFAAAILPWTTVHGADVAFVEVGKNGELSFSDIASPNATEIPLTTFAAQTLSTEEHINQMLTVARELAEARRQREAQRAAAKKARLQRSAQIDETPSSPPSILRRDVYPHPGYYPNWPRRPHRHRPSKKQQDDAKNQNELRSPLQVER